MSKKAKIISFSVAIVLVAAVMTVAIYAAVSGKATITASVSWTATEGIEFELEAWAVNNAIGGIGTTTNPLAITKQVVTSSTTNATAGALAGNLSCSFYDSTNDGVNNPHNVVFTYKITNTGDSVILVKTTKTPSKQAESGTTASNHKPAVSLAAKIDGEANGSAVNKLIGTEGYKIQPDSVFEYIVILSIANAEVNISSFDAGVTFSLSASSGTTTLTYDRSDLYALNGTTVSALIPGSTTSQNYVLYGAYPQTYVGAELNNTLKTALSAGNLQATGYSYTTDNATEEWGQPVVKVLPEYSYQGSYYAYLDASNDCGALMQENFGVGAMFSNDEEIVTGAAYFFKVEPLKWTYHNGTYLCSQTIGTMRFDEEYAVLWQNSEVRTWLNDVFYEEAGINMVKTSKSIVLNNSTESTDDGSGPSTEDYLWLPSYDEVNEWFDFNNPITYIGTGSDLVRCTFGMVLTSEMIAQMGMEGFPDTSPYWLRSADSTDNVYIVYDGLRNGFPNDTTFGVRPAFAF